MLFWFALAAVVLFLLSHFWVLLLAFLFFWFIF